MNFRKDLTREVRRTLYSEPVFISTFVIVSIVEVGVHNGVLITNGRSRSSKNDNLKKRENGFMIYLKLFIIVAMGVNYSIIREQNKKKFRLYNLRNFETFLSSQS